MQNICIIIFTLNAFLTEESKNKLNIFSNFPVTCLRFFCFIPLFYLPFNINKK